MSLVLNAIASHAFQRPNNIALSDDGTSLTYSTLLETIEELGETLARHLPATSTIAFCLENSAAWIILDLALITLGHPIIPVAPFFTSGQRAHALLQGGANILITDTINSQYVSIDEITLCGRNIYLYETGIAPIKLPRSTAKITYTSGTTAQPKGVCLSQSGMEQVAKSLVDIIGLDYAGMHCAVLPLAVLLENVAGLYPTLISGGHYRVVPLAQLGFSKPFMPDFTMLARALRNYQATSIILVPEILRGLLAAMALQNISLPDMKLVAVGGAKVSQTLLDAAEKLGLHVFQGYGLSEAASVVAFNTPGENKHGSVGKPLPHIDLSFSSDSEILISRPALLGYVGDNASPSPYATGDIGRLDEEGYLYIDGRKSNILITAFGRNIAPEWIESELLAQPQIGQAFVFGEGNATLGALIVPSAIAITNDEIAGAVARTNLKLPAYAQIAHWAKVMPFTPVNAQLTANGRLRRAVIHDHYRALMAKCLAQRGQYVGFFERLIAETASERAYLEFSPQIRDGLQGKISHTTYLDYLAQAYHHVRHTVPLMRLAEANLPAEKSWLREILAHYIAEEIGHEEWILDDIANAGGDRMAVQSGTPRLATEIMVAYAYDYIVRINPVGFFGMVFVLEGTSTQLALRGAQALMTTLGLPENCFHYLMSHGEVDLEHMRFLESLLNRIEDVRDQDAIIHMAKAMFILFANVFRAIPHDTDQGHAA